MSDDSNKPVEPDQPATGEPGQDQQGEEPLGYAGKKALAAERDARKAAEKALREAQEQIDAFKAEQMSDLEKAQAEAQKWQEEAQAATARSLRYQIATAHGISAEDAETFLTGTDEETLTCQAERLKALATPSGTPGPDPTQGVRGDKPKQTTAQKFAEAFSGRI